MEKIFYTIIVEETKNKSFIEMKWFADKEEADKVAREKKVSYSHMKINRLIATKKIIGSEVFSLKIIPAPLAE